MKFDFNIFNLKKKNILIWQNAINIYFRSFILHFKNSLPLDFQNLILDNIDDLET